MSAVSTIRSMAPAVIVSLLPKTAGSIARISDDRYAPKNVRHGTIVREASTLAQVAVYAAAIERGVRFLKADATRIAETPKTSMVLNTMRKLGLSGVAGNMAKKGEKSLFVSAMRQLEKSEPLFLAGLAFTSNISAEMISRKLSPRNVWRKPGEAAEQEKPAIQATLVDEAKGKQIPVEIEICEIGPAKRASAKNDPGKNEPGKNDKVTPRFQSKTQPVQFTSRPAMAAPAPAVNPFQVRMPSSPVARPAFQV